MAATRETMNTVVTYEAVRTLLANPPSINPRPNFFNIRELRSHFTKALKKIPFEVFQDCGTSLFE